MKGEVNAAPWAAAVQVGCGGPEGYAALIAWCSFCLTHVIKNCFCERRCYKVAFEGVSGDSGICCSRPSHARPALSVHLPAAEGAGTVLQASSERARGHDKMLCFSSPACWGTSAYPGGLAPPCPFPWSLPSSPQTPGCKSPGGSRLPMWTNGTSHQIPAWHPRPSCQGPSLTWHGQLLLLGPRPFFPAKWLCIWDTAWGLPTAPGTAVTLRKQEDQSPGGGQLHSSSRPAHNLQMSVLSPEHLTPKDPQGLRRCGLT